MRGNGRGMSSASQTVAPVLEVVGLGLHVFIERAAADVLAASVGALLPSLLTLVEEPGKLARTRAYIGAPTPSSAWCGRRAAWASAWRTEPRHAVRLRRDPGARACPHRLRLQSGTERPGRRPV